MLLFSRKGTFLKIITQPFVYSTTPLHLTPGIIGHCTSCSDDNFKQKSRSNINKVYQPRDTCTIYVKLILESRICILTTNISFVLFLYTLSSSLQTNLGCIAQCFTLMIRRSHVQIRLWTLELIVKLTVNYQYVFKTKL